MQTKKINLVYDATILANAGFKGGARSGIFFTALNILKELNKNNRFNLSFWCETSQQMLLKECINTYMPEFCGHEIINVPHIQKFIHSNYLDLSNVAGVENFNNKEKQAIWSTGDCVVRFCVNRDDISTIKVVIDVCAYFQSVTKVDILNYKNELLYSSSNHEQKIVLTLALHDIMPTGEVVLHFIVHGASSPLSLNLSEDSRNLGIFIANIAVQINNMKLSKSYKKLSVEDKLIYLSTAKIKYKKSRKHLKRFITKAKLFWFNMFDVDKRKYDDVDAFFSPVFMIPWQIKKQSNIKKYLILYDTIPLLYPKYYHKGWFEDMVKSLNATDTYFAISQSAKTDFIKFSKAKDKNIKVVPLACADTFYEQKEKTKEVLKKYNLPLNKKYVFSLCTLEPRKNLIRAVKTFVTFVQKNNIKDMIFVLGGGYWDMFIPKLEKVIGKLPENLIYKVGYVDDEDLAPLYSGAQWMVYTSEYEGFGLPPLEAMACGCPVITSNNSSLPEVVGNAGQMIDFDSDSQHIEAYEKYYFNNDFRNEMANKGLMRAKQFSWQKTADLIAEEILK